jgi:predicted MPP superfamily phosphohydrolase
MKNKNFIILFLLCIFIWHHFSESKATIQSPRLGSPYMLLPGESFEIKFKTFPLFNSNPPLFYLSSEDKGHNFSTDSSRVLLEFISSEKNVITVRVPADVSEGSYSLLGPLNLWEPRAVFIYERMPKDFRIFHAADLPDLDGGDGEKLFHALLDDVNQEKADLLLLTGDVVYHGGSERYARFYKALKEKINIPILLCPGNHEREDWPEFLKYFPERIHSRNFGEWQIISLDSGHGRDELSFSQLNWLESILRSNSSTKKIIQLHHPVLGQKSIERNANYFLNLLKTYSVTATLSGHLHGDTFYLSNGEEWRDPYLPDKPWLLTTTTYDFDFAEPDIDGLVFPGYRILEFQNNELISVGKLYPNGRSFMSTKVNLKEKLKNATSSL